EGREQHHGPGASSSMRHHETSFCLQTDPAAFRHGREPHPFPHAAGTNAIRVSCGGNGSEWYTLRQSAPNHFILSSSLSSLAPRDASKAGCVHVLCENDGMTWRRHTPRQVAIASCPTLRPPMSS